MSFLQRVGCSPFDKGVSLLQRVGCSPFDKGVSLLQRVGRSPFDKGQCTVAFFKAVKKTTSLLKSTKGPIWLKNYRWKVKKSKCEICRYNL